MRSEDEQDIFSGFKEPEALAIIGERLLPNFLHYFI
jgi:hypothetical protein